MTVPVYTPFPVDALPHDVRRYLERAAVAIGCDAAMLAVPMLAVLAGLIGNRRAIRLKDGWDEPCVVWTAIIARPSSQKSPALDAVLQPLGPLERQIHAQYTADLEHHETDVARYEQARAAWLRAKSASEPPVRPAEPVVQRVQVSDVTVEALATLLAGNPGGLLLARDELSGWARSFDAYRGGKGGDVAHWLAMHGARPLRMDRKGSGSLFVPRAAVSITGTLQPLVARDVLAREHTEDGLLSRFLLAMPPVRRKRWTDASLSNSEVERIAQLYANLHALEPMDNGAPCVLRLDAEARAAWVAFYNEHAETQERAGDDAEAAALGKLEGAAARLALVVHVVRAMQGEGSAQPDLVDGVSMACGIRLARWFTLEARRVYAEMSVGPEERAQRDLIRWIAKRGGRATERDLARGLWRCKAPGAATKALESLVQAGLGTWEESTPSRRGGRPPRIFVLARTDGIDTDETQADGGARRGSVDVDVVDGSEGAREEPG